jgi:hypothetical protein
MLHAPDSDSLMPASRSAAAESNGAVSPSLISAAGTGVSYELKFLLADALAAEVEVWAGRRLALDPHADAALANAYRIHTLYLDTPALDVLRRSLSFGRRKFRIRRYGSECGLYLERKTKRGDRVRKRRVPIPDAQLVRLQHSQADQQWEGYWFHRRLVDRSLQPTCLITYDRVARVGVGAEGPLRLTLDRCIHCLPMRDWRVADAHAGLMLLPGQVVLELKYRSCIPVLFKQLLEEFRLTPQPVSKYRLAIQAWGLDAAHKEAG